VAVRDFRNEHLILYSSPNSESHLIRDHLRPAGVTPRQLTRVQLTEAIVELVKANRGVAVLARWSVAPHVAAGTLAATPLTKHGWRRQWFAVTRAGATSASFLREFLQLLARESFVRGSFSVTPRRSA
jgi:LysR family transcriptional regulator for metE and metH